MCAWSNSWRQTTLTMLKTRAHGRRASGDAAARRSRRSPRGPLPKSDQDHEDERHALTDWLVENGVRRAAIAAFPPLQHGDVPGILRKVDAALFPNRCEAARTSSRWRRCLMGVPTILTDGTGQRDTVRLAGGGCWPLAAAPATGGPPDAAGVEVDVEHATARALEQFYLDAGGRAARHGRAPGACAPMTWGRAATVSGEEK